MQTQRLEPLACLNAQRNKHLYLIDKSISVESKPLVKFIQNYIRESGGVFSISSLVRISMTSFPAFTLLFAQKYSSIRNLKKIHGDLQT